MNHFTPAQVLELLGVADTLAFLKAQGGHVQHGDRRGEPTPYDAWLQEGQELVARWEGKLGRLQREGPDADTAWDELLIVAAAVIAWKQQLDHFDQRDRE